MCNDALAKPNVAIPATGARGCNSIDELYLADGLKLCRTIRAIHCLELCVDRCHYVMTRKLVDELVGEIASALVIPEVMVWIDDGKRGFQCGLSPLPGPSVKFRKATMRDTAE